MKFQESNLTATHRALAQVSLTKNTPLILDFDYTLLLDNSTELWLRNARPRWVAYLVDTIICRRLHSMFGMDRERVYIWMDFTRVFFTCLLLPWTQIYWRIHARTLAKTKLNHELVRAISEANPSQIIVVSNGFRHIIAPLLKYLPFSVSLVCSKMNWQNGNIRQIGKAVALQSLLSDKQLSRACFITDSDDDRDLMNVIPNSHLVKWINPIRYNLDSVYCPFRYAQVCKYPSAHYFKNQLLAEDLVILFLATWSFDPMSILKLVLLFLSLHIVYEIGYHENDTFAAKREKSPTLSNRISRFVSYPIAANAWIWAILGSAAGFFLFSLPISLNSLQQFLGWLSALVILRMAFLIHNLTPVPFRSFSYLTLITLKNFLPTVALTVTPIGLLFLFAQTMTNGINYVVYRTGGKKSTYFRQSMRICLFLFLLFALERERVVNSSFWLQIAAFLFWNLVRAYYREGRFFHRIRTERHACAAAVTRHTTHLSGFSSIHSWNLGDIGIRFIHKQRDIVELICKYNAKQVMIWGAGKNGLMVCRLLKDTCIKVAGFYDRNSNRQLLGLHVYPEPRQLDGSSFIIIAFNGPMNEVQRIMSLCDAAGVPWLHVINSNALTD